MKFSKINNKERETIWIYSLSQLTRKLWFFLFRASLTNKVVALWASYAVFRIRISVAICAPASFFVVGWVSGGGLFGSAPNTVSMAFWIDLFSPILGGAARCLICGFTISIPSAFRNCFLVIFVAWCLLRYNINAFKQHALIMWVSNTKGQRLEILCIEKNSFSI